MAKPTCTIEGCSRPNNARGLCGLHYMRWHRYGDPLANPAIIVGDDEGRFRSKVDDSGGPDACWPWTAGRHPTGYGKTFVFGRHEKAHRVAFYFEHGRWPEPLACHRCDNPPCCNPAHLYEGTPADNARDRDTRQRHGLMKVNDEDVRAIRQLYGEGVPARVIAKRFGITNGYVSRIAARKTRGHVT